MEPRPRARLPTGPASAGSVREAFQSSPGMHAKAERRSVPILPGKCAQSVPILPGKRARSVSILSGKCARGVPILSGKRHEASRFSPGKAREAFRSSPGNAREAFRFESRRAPRRAVQANCRRPTTLPGSPYQPSAVRAPASRRRERKEEGGMLATRQHSSLRPRPRRRPRACAGGGPVGGPPRSWRRATVAAIDRGSARESNGSSLLP